MRRHWSTALCIGFLFLAFSAAVAADAPAPSGPTLLTIVGKIAVFGN